MKYYLLLLTLIFCSCVASKPQPKKIKARITTYSKNEKKSDRWTKKEMSSTGLKLIDKKCVAIDPRDIPYFSKVKLPCFNYLLTAIDTGGAVKNRTAARRYGMDVPVIDLYFRAESEARLFRAKNPMFMDVLVYE